MTDAERAEVEAIEQRAENATPGPWERGTGGKFLNTVAARTIRGIAKNVCQVGGYFRGARDFNATFISAARTDIPRLILMLRAESERLREANEKWDDGYEELRMRAEKAEQELAALRDANEWHDASKELPKVTDWWTDGPNAYGMSLPVDVICEDVRAMAVLCDSGNWAHHPEGSNIGEVKFWRYLPPEPEGETNAND